MASPGLAAEPRHQVGATAASARAETRKTRRGHAGAPARASGRGLRKRAARQGRRRVGVPFQRRLKRFVVAAIGRDADQVVVGETDEGRFQRRREGEVVVGQQSRASRRHEIHDGDMLADIEPVRARHRHALFLEGPDHGLEGRAALAHQHQHVAGLPDPSGFVAARGPAFHQISDASRHHDGRRLLFGLRPPAAPRRRARHRPAR